METYEQVLETAELALAKGDYNYCIEFILPKIESFPLSSKVWNDGNGDRATIPYELSIPDDFEYREDIIHLANEALGISKRIEDNDY